MISNTAIVQSACGLHARPAADLMRAAKKYKSAIRIEKDGKSANAKSLVEILCLGVNFGDSVQIHCDGADEQQAANALKELIESGIE